MVRIHQGHVKCPHCGEAIDMGLFSAGQAPRTAEQIKADQSAAKIADANASTRPNTVTVKELQRRSR